MDSQAGAGGVGAAGSGERARDLGLQFRGVPGKHNNITDVPGVCIGYSTIHSETSGDTSVHTGVTGILPRGHDKVGAPCAAGIFSLNGNGEMTGSHWIEESGSMNSPIVLTNTLAVGTAHRGLIDWAISRHPDCGGEWLLPCVAETYDGYLNDIKGDHVKKDHVFAALDSARGDCFIEEGSVGGGCGMNSYGFKAGSGSASRVVIHGDKTYHVGVFVQSNFGRRRELYIAGVYMGELLADDNPMAQGLSALTPVVPPRPPSHASSSSSSLGQRVLEGAGSIVAIVATDAPLLPHQCKSMARRVSLGIARTGTSCSHFSGDIFLAFSTANEGALSSDMPRPGQSSSTYNLESMTFIPNGNLDPFYEAVVQSTEEAILNAIFAGRETLGINGRRVPGIDRVKVMDAIRAREKISP